MISGKKGKEKWEEETAYKEDAKDKQWTQTVGEIKERERLPAADGKQTQKAFQLRKDMQQDGKEAYHSDWKERSQEIESFKMKKMLKAKIWTNDSK